MEATVSTRVILEGILDDIQSGKPIGYVAARFHLTLVEIIAARAEELSIKRIAFSGGVFQNALLVDLILEKMRDSHTLYFHEELPPNDENISFGQLMCYEIECRFRDITRTD